MHKNEVHITGIIKSIKHTEKISFIKINVADVEFGKGNFEVKAFPSCNPSAFGEGQTVSIIGKLKNEQYPKDTGDWKLNIIADTITAEGAPQQVVSQAPDLNNVF